MRFPASQVILLAFCPSTSWKLQMQYWRLGNLFWAVSFLSWPPPLSSMELLWPDWACHQGLYFDGSWSVTVESHLRSSLASWFFTFQGLESLRYVISTAAGLYQSFSFWISSFFLIFGVPTSFTNFFVCISAFLWKYFYFAKLNEDQVVLMVVVSMRDG